MPYKNIKLLRQHKARVRMLQSGTSSLDFLKEEPEEIYAHKLNWKKGEKNE